MDKHPQTKNSQPIPPGEIQVGRELTYQEIRILKDVAVYECSEKNGSPFTIIGRRPPKEFSPSFRPGSSVAIFPSTENALEALERWASQAPPPPSPRQPQRPSGRRNGNRPKPHPDDPGQMFLDL